MECEQTPSIASSFVDSVSTGTFSFAVNSSQNRRQTRARSVWNASRYTWGLTCDLGGGAGVRRKKYSSDSIG